MNLPLPLSPDASATLQRVRETQKLSREIVRLTDAELRGAVDALHVIGVVSFVLNRSKRNFSDRDRACLEVIRPHLGNLFRLGLAANGAEDAAAARANNADCLEHSAAAPLTPREHEVLHWLAAGKTDRDIGTILDISPRTVHKHLQRIYDKLGVETRTAAVMRTLALHEGNLASRLNRKSLEPGRAASVPNR